MPLTALLALVLAFGIHLWPESSPLSSGEATELLWATGAVVLAQMLVAWGLGHVLARSVDRAGCSLAACRRATTRGSRLLDMISLLAFGAIIHLLDWPRVVDERFGLSRLPLVPEIVVLGPFLIGQLSSWMALYPLELRSRSVRIGLGARPRFWSYLLRKARFSFGLIMPAALMYGLGMDLVGRYWPEALDSPYAQFVSMAALGSFVLVAAPALVRLAWPMRPLPAGPLRERLERLSKRLGFRCSNIMVWDTDRNVLNAGVTGALPWFRYVLLTDALIDCLEERQVEAVFGHEVGHIAHRHLGYFAFFCVGSMGILALVAQGLETVLGTWLSARLGVGDQYWPMLASSAMTLGFLGIYFFLLFGFLSRRFERQADVYGCRAMSCGRPDCTPLGHIEADGSGKSSSGPTLCPVGITTFTSALVKVARLSGLEPTARSWRHGCIQRRVSFLEGLIGQPDAEQKFQRKVRWIRLVLAVGLLLALVVAIRTGAMNQF